jgi:hypothetical protein
MLIFMLNKLAFGKFGNILATYGVPASEVAPGIHCSKTLQLVSTNLPKKRSCNILNYRTMIVEEDVTCGS